MDGASPVFFSPRTLARTWGTRPVLFGPTDPGFQPDSQARCHLEWGSLLLHRDPEGVTSRGQLVGGASFFITRITHDMHLMAVG
jgi:hypothetical protein